MDRIEVLTMSMPVVQLEDDWCVQRYHQPSTWWNVFHRHDDVLCGTYSPYISNDVVNGVRVSYKCCTQCGDKVPEYVIGFINLLRWQP